MGVVSDLALSVDTQLVDYVQLIFESVAHPIRVLLKAIALVGLMFIAVNHITQYRTINYSVYLNWGLRYILIYAFATYWENFQGIYTILTEVPGDYSALMIKAVALHIRTINPEILDPARIKDTYSAMDEFAHAIVWIASDFLRDLSILHLGRTLRNIFTGVLILGIGGFFTAASTIIILIGKIGFAMAIALAPLAIIMLMMEQTRQHFESWTRFAVGFVVLPLLTTGLMSVVLYVAGEILADSHANALNRSLYFGFLFVMIAALVLLFMLPTMASTLAASSVAAVGGGAAMGMVNKAINTTKSAYSAAQRVRDAAGVANTARKAGASPGGVALAAISAMRQSAHMRRQRRDDRLVARMPGHPNARSGRSNKVK